MSFKQQIGTLTFVSGSVTSSTMDESLFGPFAAICIHGNPLFVGTATVRTSPDTSVASPVYNTYQLTPGVNLTISPTSSLQINTPAVVTLQLLASAAPTASVSFVVTATHGAM